ncbi:MAG: flagellar biosynthesis protein FlhB [Candidatus Marinimicrobia bacterium]|nr:flagellar biosynthesis protein FlhB [Candidatus Neomarinimicrobiota bacterium]MCF7841144.1 flagellar biosynthesis protein FlhB [Candidatus Neomarinimicrobiota bacterium]
MAEKPVSDKTEPASPKKLEEAREKGNVAKSAEFNSAVVLLMGITALYFVSAGALEGLNGFMRQTYQQIRFIDGNTERIMNQTSAMFALLQKVVLPLFLLIVVGGVLANISQVGINFASKALIPAWSKINPAAGFKRIFSTRSLVETVKGFVKLGIVAWLAYLVINKHLDAFIHLSHLTIDKALFFFGEVIFEMALKIGLALAVLAVADFLYQKYDYQKNLRMTKQEVKDETKQYEGSGETKGKMRSMMRASARRRMMDAVPEAAVVVTNPTHIAIALSYQSITTEGAPIVVAKGKRKIAQRIIAIANEHNIPVIQNKPLARHLFVTTEVGGEIPVEFYQIVAEVLAQVYRMKQGKVNFA